VKRSLFLYGAATIAAGIINLRWGSFAAGYQPIQAFGDNVPGRTIFAYITALWLVAGGAAIMWRVSARIAAAALAVVYLIFTIFWTPRLHTAPAILGYRPDVYIGVLAGLGQQLILVAAGVVVYVSLTERRTPALQSVVRVARWLFGLSVIDFGLAHLTGTASVAALVPKWMPIGADFWTILTGIAFALAGIAILSSIQDVLAAKLLALMLLVFSALVLAPMIVVAPHAQGPWAANAYNLTAVGAAWILAEYLPELEVARRKDRSHAALAP
jgi:uncharacterized membrane protein